MTDFDPLDNIVLQVRTGSRLFGTAIDENPDYDELGIYIESPEIALGLGIPHDYHRFRYGTADQYTATPPGGTDGMLFGLRHFLKLAAKGDLNTLTILSAHTDEHILQRTPIGEDLQLHRKDLVSKRIAVSTEGFVKSMTQKYLEKTAPSRQELVTLHGFDTKAAYVIIRSLRQAIELMQNGSVQLPMYLIWQDYCKKIRQGEYTKDEVLGQIQGMRDELSNTAGRSRWPAEPDYDRINTWCAQLYRKHWLTKEHGDTQLLTISGKHVDVL